MAHPARKEHTPNGFGHFDIAGPELAPLAQFYARLFGWQVTPRLPRWSERRFSMPPHLGRSRPFTSRWAPRRFATGRTRPAEPHCTGSASA